MQLGLQVLEADVRPIELVASVTVDLNGHNIIAVCGNQLFQVRTNVPTLFNVTNSKETGGHIVLNNRKLLSYKPVSIGEKVTIKQYDENSTEAVKSGTQTELIQSHNALELKNIKIEVVKSGY